MLGNIQLVTTLPCLDNSMVSNKTKKHPFAYILILLSFNHLRLDAAIALIVFCDFYRQGTVLCSWTISSCCKCLLIYFYEIVYKQEEYAVIPARTLQQEPLVILFLAFQNCFHKSTSFLLVAYYIMMSLFLQVI